MRRSRRAFVLLGLAAVLTPWAGAAAALAHTGLAAHEPHGGGRHDHRGRSLDLAANDHHHRTDHDHAADFQQVWHGHRHDTTTPEHSHPSVLAHSRAALAPAAPRLIPGHGSHSIEFASGAVSLRLDSGHVAAGPLAADPPPPSEPPTILRV